MGCGGAVRPFGVAGEDTVVDFDRGLLHLLKGLGTVSSEDHSILDFGLQPIIEIIA